MITSNDEQRIIPIAGQVITLRSVRYDQQNPPKGEGPIAIKLVSDRYEYGGGKAVQTDLVVGMTSEEAETLANTLWGLAKIAKDLPK